MPTIQCQPCHKGLEQLHIRDVVAAIKDDPAQNRKEMATDGSYDYEELLVTDELDEQLPSYQDALGLDHTVDSKSGRVIVNIDDLCSPFNDTIDVDGRAEVFAVADFILFPDYEYSSNESSVVSCFTCSSSRDSACSSTPSINDLAIAHEKISLTSTCEGCNVFRQCGSRPDEDIVDWLSKIPAVTGDVT